MRKKFGKKGTNLVFLAVAILGMAAILFMYIALGVPAAYAGKKDVELTLKQSYNGGAIIEKFLVFLDKEIEFNNEKILIKDLVKGDLKENKESFEKFKKESVDFLNTQKDKNFASWIRIYEKDEVIEEEFEEKYKDYEARSSDIYYTTIRSSSKPQRLSCNPKNLKSVVFFTVVHDKKISICFQEEI
ncbi:MAG: hypothetical protein ABIH37_05630 [archaeon]